MAADIAPRDDGGDRLDVEDGLEPPTLRAGLLAGIGAGAVAFIIVSMLLLFGFYRWRLANNEADPAHVFPTPRLETSIDPRIMPATPEPGPAPPVLRHAPVEPRLDLQRAMQTVAAKGAHGYDPLTETGNTAQ